MTFLADDRLEGRETGTRGYDLAAQYVSDSFRRSGLPPVAASYLQSMRIRRARVDETRSSLTLATHGRREPLVYGRDFVTYGDADETEVDVTGPVLFVG